MYPSRICHSLASSCQDLGVATLAVYVLLSTIVVKALCMVIARVYRPPLSLPRSKVLVIKVSCTRQLSLVKESLTLLSLQSL